MNRKLNNLILYFTLHLARLHDRRIAERLKSLNLKPKIIYDVGAHIGEATQFFLKNFNSIKICYCFEPQKNIFRILKKKFKNNRKVYCINKAIYDKVIKKNFNILHHQRSSTLEEINTSSLYYKVKSLILFNKVRNIIFKKEKVNCITIDSFSKKNIDILKIDVEGSELNVLKGAKKNLKNTKVILIEILNHGSIKNYSKISIFKFLEKNNFKLYSALKFPFYGFEDRIYINNKFFS
jgi:FkbM family methyltransferase